MQLHNKQCATAFQVLPKKYFYVSCPVTSLRWPLVILEDRTVVEKRDT